MAPSGGATRARFSIGGLMEIIALCCVGAASARGYYRSSLSATVREPGGFFRAVGGAALVGTAMLGGAMLLVESLLGTRRRPWGSGRWVWSISALYAACSLTFQLALALASIALANPTTFARNVSTDLITFYLLGRVPGLLTDDFPKAVFAFIATAFLTKSLRDAEADLREWSGRVFASLVIAQGIAVAVLAAR